MLFTHCQKRDFEAKKCSVLSKILICFSENPLELGEIGGDSRTRIFTAFSMQRGAKSLENRAFSGFSHLPLSSVKFRQVRFWQLDSKCRVPKRNLGFESLTLRQKPSHIKAFAHMTGLFFSLKVTSAYMIFGKSSGVPAGLPCVRQGQDIVHHICRGDLGLVIQMAVNIRRRANIAVTQPLLDLLQRHIIRQKQ